MASGTGYRCKNLHHEVLHFLPDSLNYEPLAKAPERPSEKAPKTRQRHESRITQLPLELIHMILLNLDLASLEMLCRVDSKLKSMVRSLPAYSLLREHTPNTIRLIFATGIASHCPIRQLFMEFCQPWCRGCGEFGAYLHLLTVTRACHKCCFLNPAYQVAPMTDACVHFGLTNKDIKSLPIIHVPSDPEHRLVAITQAKALGLHLHGSQEAMDRESQERRKEYEEEYRQRYRDWMRGQRPGDISRGPGQVSWRQFRRIPDKPGQDGCESMWSLETTIAFPYWDRQAQTLEPGTFCRACAFHWTGVKMWDWQSGLNNFPPYPPSMEAYYRAFLESDLPEHFRRCVAVKENYDFRKARKACDWREGSDFVVKL